ncbi:Methionine aminopeptidase [uncultured archaeon]|nr:Methionine aminopeptidase [uncultured archaeon]
MDIDFSDMEEDAEAMAKRIDYTTEAGKVATQVRDGLKIKPGDTYSDIAGSIESKIKELGCEYAFPLNVSVNEITAHDTAGVGDSRSVTENDVVKIDIGVHKDGWIADGAITYDISGKHGKLLEAGKLALENGVSVLKAGKSTTDLGAEIEKTVKSKGFKLIDNLNGHGLERYLIHTAPDVPNYPATGGYVLQEGDIIAIEPFVTYPDKAGHVVEMDRCEIFSIGGFEPTRNTDARRMLNNIFNERKTLPFAERHYAKTPIERLAMRELLRNGSLIAYPVLREKSGGVVTQFEHTVLIEKSGAKILF